ncbi:MAG TPA: DUF1697 domain-containing protein [Flavobacteriaceae bacterium]|nr:DUF1697 domain-containing protein [Flavobacteriaceae bacterium]
MTHIALLRGINVSGQKKIPMVELRKLLTDSGFDNVKTYIQSGNVIFRSSQEKRAVLENTIQKAIKLHFGFEVPVLVRTETEIQNILEACPFPEEKKTNGYFTLLHSAPDKSLVEETRLISYPDEEFHITNRCVYFFSSTGYGKAKCNNNFFERKLKVSATTRNYKTMVKLLSLCAKFRT